MMSSELPHLALSCNVWDAHMGSVIPMTTTEFNVNARGRACIEGGVVVTSGMHIWAL